MHFAWGACAAAVLLVGLTGCASAGGLFSEDNVEPAQAVERDPPAAPTDPLNKNCSHLAAQRADDALMAGYVTENSPDQKAIYNVTYRDCMGWKPTR